jgi:hypothetical protein
MYILADRVSRQRSSLGRAERRKFISGKAIRVIRSPTGSLWSARAFSRFRCRPCPPAGYRRIREVRGLYVTTLALALRRPRLIPHLVGAAWAFRARKWYTRPPFLPLPPRSYMQWRMETAYGDPDAVPSAEDLERYLVWTSRMRREMRR